MQQKGIRFNSQYPLLLAAVKAVSYMWAKARESVPEAAAPPSLYFLEAVLFCCDVL
jgi:hypothetical protein